MFETFFDRSSLKGVDPPRNLPLPTACRRGFLVYKIQGFDRWTDRRADIASRLGDFRFTLAQNRRSELGHPLYGLD